VIAPPDAATAIVLERLARRLYEAAIFGPMDGRQYRDIRDYVWWLQKHARPDGVRTLWESKGRWN
jgi:hypothetical protein